MKRGSKQWWNISRDLLSQRTKLQSIPALKDSSGKWSYEPLGKAELLAETLSGKNVLPAQENNEYSDIELMPHRQKGLRQLTLDDAIRTLTELDAQSGTGPDLLPSRILKVCASQLAGPVLQLANTIIESGEWPECWRAHWIAPIHKCGATFLPKNYRGIHLTTQLSKVIERLFLSTLAPYVELRTLAGNNQFAFTKNRGSRDVLALLAMRWVRAIEAGQKVLVYCADVAGAFDKVPKTRLLDKLAATGIDPKLLKVTGS